MLVVSDTSPIRALHHLGLLNVLQVIFDAELVPPAMVTELATPKPHMDAVDIASVRGVHVAEPHDTDLVRRRFPTLHEGELQAIALASERHSDAVLIDESAGRLACRELGLQTIGVLGILIRAKELGLLPAVGPLMDRLVSEIGFRMSPPLRLRILALAGETDA